MALTKEDAQQVVDLAKTELGKIAEGLKSNLDAQGNEIREFGESSKETAERIKALDERYNEATADLAGAKERLEQLEVKLNRSMILDESDVEERLSPGQQFAKSGFPQEMESDGMKSSKRLNVKSFHKYRGMTGLNFGKKEVSRFAPDGTTRLLLPQMRGDVIAPERSLRLRDLLTIETATSDTVQYVEELGFAPFMTRVAADAAAADTAITVELAEGMHVDMVLTIAGVDGTRRATAINYTSGVITLDAALGAAVTAGTKVTSMTLGAHIERRKKPQADIEFGLRTESFRTIAHWIPAPRQVLRDIPRLENYIDRRLMYGLDLAEEHHILYGDGSDRMLQGILTHPRRQTYRWSDGNAGDTPIDAIRRAATRAELAEYPANGFVIHPLDWENIELMKGSDAHYIWVNVQEGGTTRLWRMPAVSTKAIGQGEVAVGAWNMASVLYDLEQAHIRVAEQHAEFFVENMVAILAEESLIFVHERPEAYVHTILDAAPAA